MDLMFNIFFNKVADKDTDLVRIGKCRNFFSFQTGQSQIYFLCFQRVKC